MRKMTLLILCVYLLMFFTLSVAVADSITPFADPTTTLIMGLTFSGNTGEAYAHCDPASPRSAMVTIRIEKYVNGKWTSVASSKGATQASVTCSLTKGIQYRAYGTAHIYENGHLVDSAKKYSSSLTYE